MLFRSHPERAVNKRNDVHREEMLAHMLNELGDRDDLVAKCVPDYPPYGKRILLDNGWFAALRRPHVVLVDTPIERVDGSAIVTNDGGRHDVDVLVLAGLYSHRIFAGSLSADVTLSFWLAAFSLFCFLSLALVKRYAELHALLASNAPTICNTVPISCRIWGGTGKIGAPAFVSPR